MNKIPVFACLFVLSSGLVLGQSYTWNGDGSGGTWADGSVGKFGQTYSNSLSSSVVFSGTRENITISGTVLAGSLNFQPTNSGGVMNLTGGTLELGGAVTVKSGLTGGISSILAGTNGFQLSGGTFSLNNTANSFSGGILLTGGSVLNLSSDAVLGNAQNDLVMNNGKLDISGHVSLGAGRDVTGTSAQFWMNANESLTVNGNLDFTSTVLQGGLLNLQGATRKLGTLSLSGSGSTVQGAGALTLGAITSTHSGTNLFQPAVNFGTTSVAVTDNGSSTPTTKFEGAVTLGGSGVLSKVGGGTMELNATGNSIHRLQIGGTVSSTNISSGGLVRVADSSGLGNNTLYLNSGILEAKNSLSSAVGLAIRSRNGGGVLAGSNMVFGGTSYFEKAYTTAGDEMSLTVNNQTTLNGAFSATANAGSGSGVGLATNIVFRGNGTLHLNGTASTISENIVVRDSLKLNVNSSLGTGAGTFLLASTATLGGSGTIRGSATLLGTHAPGNSPGIQTFANGVTYGASSTLVWELSGNSDATADRGLLYDGVNVTAGNFTVETGATINLVFSSLLADGSASSVNWANSFWDTAQSWVVVDFSSLAATSSGSFTLGSVGTDSLGQNLATVRNGAGFSISNVNGDIVLAYSIPEPSSHGLFLCGVGMLALRRAYRPRET